MALANVRERLALHFDAEASLESRVTRDGYEVHIRVPYRTASAGAGAASAASPALKPAARRARSRQANPRAAAPCRRCIIRRCPVPEMPLRVLHRRRRGAGPPPAARAPRRLHRCAAASPSSAKRSTAARRSICCSRAPAELVLTDIHMPDMDGIELARHLLKLPHPPVVIFTTAFHEHALQAFEVNAVDYLVKPVRVQRLLARAAEGAAPEARHGRPASRTCRRRRAASCR